MTDNADDIIEKRLKYYTQIDHTIREKWLRVLGPTTFTVWYCLKSFCSTDKQTIIPKTTHEDWAGYIGIDRKTFIKSIMKLKELNLLNIKKLKKTKTNKQPYEYKLNEIPNKIPNEILLQQNIKSLNENSSFIDQIFNPSKDIFNKKSKSISLDSQAGKIPVCLDSQAGKIPVPILIEKSLNIEKSLDISKDISYASSKDDAIINTNIILRRNAPTRNNIPQLKENEKKYIIKENNIPQSKKNWMAGKKIIIDSWNNIPQTTKHKDMSTKTMCLVSKNINYLLNGTFFKMNKMNEDWMKRNNIPSFWLNSDFKFTQREILTAINNFKLYWQEGYWPVKKSTLPKSLQQFICNENFKTKECTSFLLKLIANPKVKSFKEQEKEKNYIPEYTEPFQRRNLLIFFTEDKLPNVYRSIQNIENRVFKEGIFEFKNGSTNPKLLEIIGSGPGKLAPMFNHFAAFLKDFNRLEPEMMFHPYGYFNDFLEHLQQTYSSFSVNI